MTPSSNKWGFLEMSERPIKTVKSFSFLAALMLAAVFGPLFFSCSNLGEDVSYAPNLTSQAHSEDLQKEMGRVSGTIKDVGDEQVISKTVAPTASDITNAIVSYAVYAWGTTASGTVVLQSSPIYGTVDAVAKTFSLELEYGTWTIRADAVDSSGDIVLSDISSGVVLSAESSVINLSFSLGYFQDAGTTGALSLALNYSISDNISDIYYSLSPSSGSAIEGTQSASSAGTIVLDSALNPSFGALEPGTYSLVVKFLDDDGGVVVRVDQAVQIYSNLTTNKIDGTAPYINAGGTIDITSDVIKKYQSSVIYVGGTGLTGTAASDANNGSQYEPVATIERAFNIINESLLTPAAGFTIYLQANKTISQNILVASSSAINIIGTKTSGGYYRISGGSSHSILVEGGKLNCSYISLSSFNGFVQVGSASQVNLTNCNVTMGTAPESVTGSTTYSVAGGGGLCVQGGKAVLANCVISGCNGDFGGAVYVGADSGTAEVQLTDCVLGSEIAASCASSSSHSNSALNGGGLYVASGGKAVLSSTKIFYNYASTSGGGIYCVGTLQISGGQINFNRADYGGGGIFLYKIGSSAANATIDDCVIGVLGASSAATEASCGNYSADQGGGGILLENATLSTSSGFSVIKNYSVKKGGGITVNESSSLTLVDSLINYNASASSGGGIDVEKASSFKVKGGQINYNYAASNGGGLCLYTTQAAAKQFEDVEVKGNEAVSNGGGIQLTTGKYLTVTNCDISENKAASGAGIFNAGTVTFASGTVKSNTAENGAGIYNNGTVTFSGGTIESNTASKSGGGVYLSSGTFTMDGGSISKNLSSEHGGAVYSLVDFTMGGAAFIPFGDESGTTGQGYNDVYLESAKTINISSALTSASTPVASITPKTYSSGTQVLTATAALMTSEISKFAVTDDSSGESWTIVKDSAGTAGVLYSATIYVDGVNGSDSTGAGTLAAPYATIAKALQNVLAANCLIVVTNGTTESSGLNVTEAMQGLTIRSNDSSTKTITQSAANKEIYLQAAASIKGLAFDGFAGLNVADDVQGVELKEVSLANCHNPIAGGGLWLGSGAEVTASNLSLLNCYVDAVGCGGGISVGVGASLTIDGFSMSGCYVSGANSSGGGIYNYGTTVIKDAEISSCSTTSDGNGIYNANGATLVLDGECDIQSDIYLHSASNILYVDSDFALKSGASAIPLSPHIEAGYYQVGSAVVQGYGAHSLTSAQSSAFCMANDLYSLSYDASSVPRAKIIDVSTLGGISVSFAGGVSFAVQVPTTENKSASFTVLDSSGASAQVVVPTSSQISIMQYGSAIYSADAQSVTATYLPQGSYALYCKAVYNGLVYDTTVDFTIDAGGGSVLEGFVEVTGATVRGAVTGSYVFIEGRTVTIADMYVSDHEVTQAEYETYCKYGSSSPSDNYGVGDNYLAYYVSWYDAVVYCNLRSIAEKLTPAYKIEDETDPSKWTGIVSGETDGATKYCGPSSDNSTWDALTYDSTADGYRLPTEAEWEYIVRGGNGGISETQYTYSGSDTIGDVAWYKENSDSKTHEVKTKAANSLGVYDMSGNVYEWCYDWYGDISSSTGASGASSGFYRVDRGGSWSYSASYCTVAYRYFYFPYDRYSYFGFRVVRSSSAN